MKFGGETDRPACFRGNRASPSSSTGDALAEHIKTPVAIRCVNETLPRNANGKILQKDLKVLFEDRVGVAA